MYPLESPVDNSDGSEDSRCDILAPLRMLLLVLEVEAIISCEPLVDATNPRASIWGTASLRLLGVTLLDRLSVRGRTAKGLELTSGLY